MEKRRGSFSNDLGLTKSAAWAWLEHRSGSDSRSTPEYEVSRTKFQVEASRFKAEAVRIVEQNKKSAPTKSNGYCSLLDRHDIDRISRQLDYYIESSQRRVEVEMMKSKHGGRKKAGKGLWLGWSHVPLACGSASSRDVVLDGTSISYSSRPRRRSFAEVEVVGCRPRQGIRA